MTCELRPEFGESKPRGHVCFRLRNGSETGASPACSRRSEETRQARVERIREQVAGDIRGTASKTRFVVWAPIVRTLAFTMQKKMVWIMYYRDHFSLKRGSELRDYFKTVVEAMFFVFLVLFLICKGGWGMVIVKISSLLLNVSDSICPIDIQVDLLTARWTSIICGSRERYMLEFWLWELLASRQYW